MDGSRCLASVIRVSTILPLDHHKPVSAIIVQIAALSCGNADGRLSGCVVDIVTPCSAESDRSRASVFDPQINSGVARNSRQRPGGRRASEDVDTSGVIESEGIGGAHNL